jgi:TolA-binding protein
MNMCEKRNLSLLILGGALVAGALGCATTKGNWEREKEALQREVARLNADKANLLARASALEDETLVLEKKASQCALSSRPTLPVIRLEARNQQPEDIQTHASEERNIRSGERPLLSLGSNNSGFGSASPQRTSSVRASEASTVFGAPDSLGVTGEDMPKISTSSMDLFNEGYRLYANGQYKESLEVLGEFATQSPNHDYADDALFWRAECYLAMNRQLRAVGELERLLKRYPRSDKKSSALWRIGNAYDKLGDSTQALGYYFRVVEEFPSTDVARKASQRVAALSGAAASGRIVHTAAP